MSEHATPDESNAAESFPATDPFPSDGFTVYFTPERQRRRRVRYQPRHDADGWWRIDEASTGCTWRIVGREPGGAVTLERGIHDE